MRGGIIGFFTIKQIGSGRALKKWGKTLNYVSCFPLHFFRALPLPTCFTTEQSTVKASLFVKYLILRKINHIMKEFSQYSVAFYYKSRVTFTSVLLWIYYLYFHIIEMVHFITCFPPNYS